ncbi:phosphate ABC transporter membrane protein 2 (PhoT family) [Litoreibacter ponti]|uniref:Phosphate transport system permease protein PstA n=1 Tax=Litoreibacter ponti TaxID=1510457 RepID=A0A2T6BIY4_9RHOB|nr:phosphate ABC transporter permease PstA [Litoreibacter ponti]PTX56012.1 phosphate ABC transporter membrane protein 2 (PhoT family) [Litoreibacter ponti]
MVDMTALTDMHSGEASRKRIARRRAAETRLKAYGILALFLAGAALVALLGSVFTKAGGALTETYLTMPVTLDASEIDPEGTGDASIIRRGDFTGLVKDMLKEQFPNAKGRTTRRELYDLTSAGAPFELADHVAANPSLVGETITFPLLASDVTDLYLKGAYGNFVAKEVEGQLTLSEDGDAYRVSSTAPDFEVALERVKEGLITEARKVRGQARLQENGVVEFTRRAEAAETVEEREKNEKLAEARAAARDQFLAQAVDLEARAAAPGGDEELSEDNRSVLINVAGSWLKMTRITPAGGIAEPLIPLDGDVSVSDDWQLYTTDLPEASRKVSDNQIVWIEQLRDQGRVDVVFNTRFFTAGDSREPELAGIWGAVVGSFWTMLVTFALAFPIGVLAAIYLEEFAPKNKLTDFIEVNINNLAAVPSIVFGLLGLSVFLGVFGVPRSAPIAGGIVLALMTLPTIIIASRAAIRAVPPSIRDAAVGLGASPLQATFHHVLPLAMPGILTGTIIGMAQALGETAPLIMIGMVAFIVDIPQGITDSASVLPVQVFRWSDFPERAFEARTAAAICVLLLFLVVMNAIAVFLRKRFERRW